jgi:hypothetical protein
MVEVWINGTKRSSVEVELSGYASVVTAPAGRGSRDGRTSWDGRIVGSPAVVHEWYRHGHELELRFPNGRVGIAILQDADGTIEGLHEAPFA